VTRSIAPLHAFVLHHYAWSESSLILDVFTREQGRLVLVAKGARRPYSQLRSVLLPFQRLLLSLGRAPASDSASEVQNLRGAEWAGGQAMLTGAALFSGLYLNELLMKLLARSDPHVELFDAYANTLPHLANPLEAAVQASLRAFELKLLQTLGVLPDLSLVTLTQQTVRVDASYTLDPQAGVLMAKAVDIGTVSGQALVGLQAALQHGSLLALQQACAAHLSELRLVLRGLLHYHLGSPHLRTRQLMLDVQALERTPSP
jgi:DNA repair protein RecO (recombination protein O)